MKNFYNQDLKEVFAEVKAGVGEGLSTEEAERRAEEFGYNVLIPKRRKSFFSISSGSLKAS